MPSCHGIKPICKVAGVLAFAISVWTACPTEPCFNKLTDDLHEKLPLLMKMQ